MPSHDDVNSASKPRINGCSTPALPSPSRAEETSELLQSVLDQLIPFLQRADDELFAHQTQPSSESTSTSLVNPQSPERLMSLLKPILTLSDAGFGSPGLLNSLTSILSYSVNPSSPGFLDKLYSGPLAPGIAADLILSVLNTNLHVYQVSPVLTLIEKHVSRSLAHLFGFNGPRAGGISVQGGSGSNLTSIVIARNTLYPGTKVHGNSDQDGKRELVMFTSAHGHYSIEKAAQACGFGSAAVVAVPVDAVTGAMRADELERLVLESQQKGKTPFYVNATAGTTVLGSFDPFEDIARVARKHGLWMHVDGAWGGSFVFSSSSSSPESHGSGLKQRLKGVELADSIAINPHKMMGVPVTCSFLLGRDMRVFHEANTLRAGYLFHDDDEVDHDNSKNTDNWTEPHDLADLTLQCGRRGDSLKLFLCWQYYGSAGYAEKINHAHRTACYLADLIERHADMVLVSQNPPPCLQVCFRYAPGRAAASAAEPPRDGKTKKRIGSEQYNSKVTERITKALVPRGFMIDFAPALAGQEANGKFFRVVVNIQTCRQTVERLVGDVHEIGRRVVVDLAAEYTVDR